MKIKEYDTDELLLIANNVTGEYTDKQVRQAKLELYNRGVDDKVITDIMEEKEEAFMRRLDAAARAEKARMDKQNEKNRNGGKCSSYLYLHRSICAGSTICQATSSPN